MDHFQEYIKNPNLDLTLSSPIPKSCLSEEVMLGIDEAGRGPVLGPMVYAVAYFPLRLSSDMKKMEFADSKTLTEAKREKIFTSILNRDEGEQNIGWSAVILSPNTISNTSFRRKKYNLNQLSHDTAIQLVQNCLDSGIKVKELYVDTVGPQDKYRAKLREVFPNIPKITVESKADSKFHVVSAASICAKVIRDKVIDNWQFPENKQQEIIPKDLPRGSGYPGDEPTKKFLRHILDPIFGFPTFVRFCWSTVKVLLDKDAVECEWEEDDGLSDQWNEEEDDELASGNKRKKKPGKSVPITTFFKKETNGSENSSKKIKTHEDPVFFVDRNLTRVTSASDLI